MLKLLLRRILLIVPTLLAVALIVFLLVELMPGDPAEVVAGENATPETVSAVRHNLGLDKPFFSRFGIYVTDTASGNLGKSLITSQRVTASIGQSLPVTMSLALVAMSFVILFGFGAGLLAAVRRGGPLDRLVTAASGLALAVPPFIFAFLLIIPFALDRSWFPATGYSSISNGVGTWLRHLVLPGLALSLTSAAELARQVRGAVIDALEQDYVRTARASGLSRRAIVMKHALKNSGIPIVTVLGLQVGRILGGAIVVERVFAIPGFGSLAYEAVLQRDLPVIQGVVLVSALIVLVTNLLVDVSYGYFNPRLRT